MQVCWRSYGVTEVRIVVEDHAEWCESLSGVLHPDGDKHATLPGWLLAVRQDPEICPCSGEDLTRQVPGYLVIYTSWTMPPYSQEGLDFGQSNEIVPRHRSVCINQWNRSYIVQAYNQRSFKINTAESAQPRNCSIVTRPFSSWEGGV